MASTALADSCDSVIEIRPGDYIAAFGNVPGTQIDQFKYWMRKLTAEQLDSVVAENQCRGRDNAYIMVPNKDQDTSVAVHGVCRQVYQALKCYQALGWPFSRNPRAVAKPEPVQPPPPNVPARAPERSAFDIAKANGYAALLDLAEKSGCMSNATVRIEECRKISAAAVISLWSDQDCARNTSRELCQTALRLNGNLGTQSAYLPVASTNGINTDSADRCVTATKDAMFGYFVNSCAQTVEVKFFDLRPDRACSTGCATGVPGGARASINLYEGSPSFAACFSPTHPVGYNFAGSSFTCR